ncbi:hypothetical protein SPI_06004 [Niveomyces insectorum RCEF 264]|uniref:Oxidoreductase-like protein n=1 Tax=Niveomyces insectorum RCEF 264 TaxID=1081102 RepID=A0A167SPC5_9HYPO|nr:hypothetical protein SPI_06004 [Niveomyces insectorum RCEF 264]
MASRSTVEAGSLSALNMLAANPPQYPHNPTEEPHDPLTLYISRVPGTRDVVLSTLKPRRKNVTSEDVAQALYYVHLDLPSDELLAPPLPAKDPHTAATMIARKPVPGAVPAVKSTDPSIPPLPTPAAHSTQNPPQQQSERQDEERPRQPQRREPQQQHPEPPLHSGNPVTVPQPWIPPGFRLDEQHSFDSASHAASPSSFPPSALPSFATPSRSQEPSTPTRVVAPVPRKPIGPRLIGTQSELPRHTDNDPPPAYALSTSPDRRGETPQAPPMPPSLPPRPMSLPPAKSTPSNYVPFQLTLIRRDPSSNHQWNVGKIASVQAVDTPPALPISSPPYVEKDELKADSATQQPTIRIHLQTSGYAKFRGFPSRRSIENASRDNPLSSLPRSSPATKNMHAYNEDDARQGGFTREVVMSYTKSWTAGIRNAFKRHDRDRSMSSDVQADNNGAWDAAGGDLEPPPSRQSLFTRARASSLTSGGSRSIEAPTGDGHRETGFVADNTGRTSPPPLITRPGPGLKPKGYVFTSPWDGRCDFRTGNGGRTLTCRHILHPNGGMSLGGGGVAGYNPLVLAQNLRDGQGLVSAVASTAGLGHMGGGSKEGGSKDRGGGAGGGRGGRGRANSLTSALMGAVPVSELRFNLPNTDLFRPKPPASAATGNETGAGKDHPRYSKLQDQVRHLQQQYQMHHNRQRRGSSSTDDDYDEDDNDDDNGNGADHDAALDLSLGRERAGGGNRGKRAKLGKLILYDEAFKMLDLVVAANMGIWWVAWEKNY